MELKMHEYQLPEKILFNYEELKRELTEKVSHYETLVYTDDQIKEAKADKAALNKLKKALNDERIRREREYIPALERRYVLRFEKLRRLHLPCKLTPPFQRPAWPLTLRQQEIRSSR